LNATQKTIIELAKKVKQLSKRVKTLEEEIELIIKILEKTNAK